MFVLISAAGAFFPGWMDASPASEKPLVVSFFWGEGCPHCEKEKQFLLELQQKHPSLIVQDYEVWKNSANKELYQRVLASAGTKQAGVPGTVVGPSFFFGFTDATRKGIIAAVGRCLKEGCPDAVAVINSARLTTGTGAGTLALPFFGEVDPAKWSLPVFTVVIAGLDSFNPCAFFVLLFLLSLLVHARSRGRMLLIGGIFVLASGVVYFLFMAAWLSVFLVVGRIAVITAIGGIVALAVGGINIKDFFLFKQGVSLTIPEAAKPRLFERMRGLLKATSLGTMAAGASVLAVAANAYELLCTAGFPMVYTRVLTLRGLATAEYYRYLALYNIIYVIPLAVIVGVITATLGARKLTEWQGRQLKLLSGLMMAALGAVLIIDPAFLNNALASFGLLAGVLAVSWMVIAVTKRMRPEMAG